MIDLDANFLIDFFRDESGCRRATERWLQEGETITISAIAWAEFLCGPLTPGQVSRARVLVSQIEPFGVSDAVMAADLFNAVGRRPRALADCMIAALAMRRNAALATSNRADFRKFERLGLRLAQ